MLALTSRRSTTKIVLAPYSRRQYNTFFERQTNFAPLNMDTTAIINIFDGLTLSHGYITLPQALLAT